MGFDRGARAGAALMDRAMDCRELFREHGLRCTRQREAVYRALRSTDRHPTAEELRQSVAGDEGGMSLATVYNTLSALSEAGLCRRIPSSEGACRFDADTSNHAHLVLQDGRVIDLPKDLSDRVLAELPAGLLEEIGRRTGTTAHGLTVQVSATEA